jgi:hypothetical protein
VCGAGSAGAKHTRLQIPLKLGWALTVHRAQGMTLSRVELMLEGAFACGQAYVALSRVTGLQGLWMRSPCATCSSAMRDPEPAEIPLRFPLRVFGCWVFGFAALWRALV